MRLKITLLSICFVMLSCGSSTKTEDKKDAIKLKNRVTTQESSISEDGISKVYLTGNDQMKFNLKEIRVKSGDKVQLVFEHVGQMSVETMGHNFVLLKQGTNVQKFGAEAVQYKENAYIPKMTNDVIVHTKMLGGGEKTTLTFDAPEVGTYDFICSFPGHLALMKGKFIVE